MEGSKVIFGGAVKSLLFFGVYSFGFVLVYLYIWYTAEELLHFLINAAFT